MGLKVPSSTLMFWSNRTSLFYSAVYVVTVTQSSSSQNALESGNVFS